MHCPPNGKLDLSKAPLRLNAIVNRIDLRDLVAGHAGEARFVFSMESNGFPLQATLIMDYRLPAATAADVQGWADSWPALGALPFPSEQYNVALQALTDKITGAGRSRAARTAEAACACARTRSIPARVSRGSSASSTSIRPPASSCRRR